MFRSGSPTGTHVPVSAERDTYVFNKVSLVMELSKINITLRAHRGQKGIFYD